MVENEIEIMKRCKHENIIKLIEEFETPTELYLVMELVKVFIILTPSRSHPFPLSLLPTLPLPALTSIFVNITSTLIMLSHCLELITQNSILRLLLLSITNLSFSVI